MPAYQIEQSAPRFPVNATGWVAPSADLIGDVICGADVSVWFGAIIRADNTPITLGKASNIQDGAILHSDPDCPLIIGEGVTIGHHAILHGCIIGNNVLVGMGAIILNRATIGADCLIGAGALVTEGKCYPDGSLIVGAPARIVRSLTADEIASNRRSAAAYKAKADRYRMQMVEVG